MNTAALMNVRVSTAEVIAAAKRVALVAERNTSLRMLIGDGVVTLEAATGDQAQASEAIEATVDQPGGGDQVVTAAGFNPTYLLDALGAFDTPYVNFALHRAEQALPADRAGRARRRAADRLPARDHADAAAHLRLAARLIAGAARGMQPMPTPTSAMFTRSRSIGVSSMQLGMVGLGRMGANIVRRLMRDGHECVVFDVNPDVRSRELEGEGAAGGATMEEFVGKLQTPRVVWVMIPAGITGTHGRRAGRAARRRATSSSTAATPTTATTSAGPRSCASRASTTSTSAPAAASSVSSAATA